MTLFIKKQSIETEGIYCYWGREAISDGEEIEFTLGADGKIYRSQASMPEGQCLRATALGEIAPGDFVVFYKYK